MNSCWRVTKILGACIAIGCAVAVGVLAGSGCSATQEKPACTEATLAYLETQYVAEALQVCAGYEASECPELPAIREKYRLKREEWVSCR